MNLNPLNVDGYCEDKSWSMHQSHPKFLETNGRWRYDVGAGLERVKDELYTYLDHSPGSFYAKIHDKKYISPLVEVMSNHYAFEEVCRSNEADADPFKCALMHTT